MKIYNRAYDDKYDDFKKMWDFLIADYSDRKDAFTWTLGRLTDWKYGLWHENKYIPSFHRKNAQLWLSPFDELVGFVISEEGDNMFFLFATKGFEHLYISMLDWVRDNWIERNETLLTEVHEFQEGLIKILEVNGFKNKGVAATTRKYFLKDKEDRITLGEGFSITDMIENNDFAGKRLLQKNAFRNENTVNKLDMLAYEYHRESPIYNPYYDLSVIDKNGVHVSGCLAFVDYENRYAEIERVCTHSDYRRKGLCEAVIKECFQRLKEEGIEYAYITGYSNAANGLYEKVGAVTSRKWFQYELG